MAVATKTKTPSKATKAKTGRKAAAAKAKPVKTTSFVAHAEKILRAKGEPMHVKDITERALKAGLKTGGKTPAATMAARMGGAPERFTKLGKGMFELK